MRALNLFVFAFLVIGAHPSPAADSKCAVDTLGDGQTPCGKWLEARERNQEQQVQMYLGFLAGFMTARNYYVAGNAGTGDVPAIRAYMDRYCRKYPSDLLLYAAIDLVRQTGGPSNGGPASCGD
jgi:hypothetical protein